MAEAIVILPIFVTFMTILLFFFRVLQVQQLVDKSALKVIKSPLNSERNREIPRFPPLINCPAKVKSIAAAMQTEQNPIHAASVGEI